MDMLATLAEVVPAATMRDKVFAIEALMLQMPQVDMPPTHHFAPGIYAREITIPAGTTLTGKIHKFAQLNILSQGDISVLTEDGIQRVQAPFTIVSPPGTKRIAFAHTECVWTTIHGTDETDLIALENELIAPDQTAYLAHRKTLSIGAH